MMFAETDGYHHHTASVGDLTAAIDRTRAGIAQARDEIVDLFDVLRARRVEAGYPVSPSVEAVLVLARHSTPACGAPRCGSAE
jgi:hypothetical protein